MAITQQKKQEALPELERKPRLQILESLRGIAAISIVLFHFLRVYENHVANFIIELGRIGTDVFFVLSGFLTAIAAKSVIEGKRSPLEFLASRAYRIYLVYFFSLICSALVIPIAIGLLSFLKHHSLEFDFVSFSVADWIKIITLTKVFDSTDWMLYKSFLPLNGVYWFIAVIVQIYCFIFICLLYKNLFYWLSTITGLLSIICLYPAVKQTIPYGFFIERFHEFFFGMVSYWIYSKYGADLFKIPRVIIVLILMTIPILNLTITNEQILRSAWALLLAILIPCLLINNHQNQGSKIIFLFSFLGKFSFSIYLLHIPLFPLVEMLSRNLTGLSKEIYIPLVVFPAIIFICYYWSLFFEKPGSLNGIIKAIKNPMKTILNEPATPIPRN